VEKGGEENLQKAQAGIGEEIDNIDFQGGREMFNKIRAKILLSVILLVSVILISTSSLYAQPAGKNVSGTLSAQLDNKKGTVTAMFVGYTEGSPVVVGPYSWDISRREFSKATATDIGKRLFAPDCHITKVTKSTNSGKEIIANVVVENPKPCVVVGR
jgi:hypothetical protein